MIFYFFLLGGGHKRKVVKNHIEKFPKSNVFLLPHQPFEILADVLSAPILSFVCLENDFTGFSVPSKSYGIMAARTALVGLLDEQSEIAQIIRKYECGINYDKSKDKETLAVMLENFIKEENFDRYSENSYNAFIENFDLSIAAKKYNSEINKIIYNAL